MSTLGGAVGGTEQTEYLLIRITPKDHMFEVIFSVVNSWVGKFILIALLVFGYYYLWTVISMFLFSKNTKFVLLHKKYSTSKFFASLIVTALLIVGLNLTMYSLGFYDQNPDIIFLILFSGLFPNILLQMISIMDENNSGGKEFYDIVMGFILTVAFISPTKNLLALPGDEKLYLLFSLLLSFILLNTKLIKKSLAYLIKKINDLLIEYFNRGG